MNHELKILTTDDQKRKPEYKFTSDWFSFNVPIWKQLLDNLTERKMFLEIGSYEGRATTWLMDNYLQPGGTMYCIDAWKDYVELKHMDEVYQRFLDNVQASEEYSGSRFHVMKGDSPHMIADLISSGFSGAFDFVYVDGGHTAKECLSDMVMAFELLREGGLMIMDDYLWGTATIPLKRPKPAIDAFVNLFGEHLNVVAIGNQCAIVKATSNINYEGLYPA